MMDTKLLTELLNIYAINRDMYKLLCIIQSLCVCIEV